MLMLLVKFIYVDYHQSVEYDRKHILSHRYKEYSICFSSIEENSENQCECIG